MQQAGAHPYYSFIREHCSHPIAQEPVGEALWEKQVQGQLHSRRDLALFLGDRCF